MIHLLSNRQGNGARLKIYIALSNDIASIAVKVEEGKRFFFYNIVLLEMSFQKIDRQCAF